MDSHLVKRERHRQFYKHNLGYYLPSAFLPADTLEHYILTSRIAAASKIQSIWRGYKIRKTFVANKNELQKTKAAIIIQRSVREWLHKKKTNEFLLKVNEGNVYYLEKIDEEKIPKLQEKINCWNNANNDANFESHETLQRKLETVQTKLTTFYERAATRNERMQRYTALSTQIEAIVTILTDLPSLEQSHQTVDIFQTPIVSDAKIARQRHKQQLKTVAAPWWKRLNLQTENVI